MKFQLTGFFTLILFPITLLGQSLSIGNTSKENLKVNLHGWIRDAWTNEPLPGSSVFFADLKLGTSADSNGHYSFTNIPEGHHVIEVSHSGYGTLVEHIEVHTNLQKDFLLSPVITENQAVIVTGVSGATSIRKTPVPVTQLRKNVLLQTTSGNIIDALTRIPGVSQLSTGPAISKPVIRGLGYNRVVTINDGMRQEGQQWGDEHGIEIDEHSITRAEVLKGPASLMYGSDAMAGVVNFITNTPVPEGTLRTNIFSNYQTNNKLIALHGSAAGHKNGINWNIYGSYKKAGDYQNEYDGRVLNSRFNEKNFGGYIGLNKSWGYSHLIFSRFNQKAGVVEGDRDDNTGKFLLYPGSILEHIATDDELDSKEVVTPYQHIQHYRVISENNWTIGKNRLKWNAGFQQNQRKEFGNPEDPSEEELFFDLQTINYNFQWQLPEMKEWHTTIGVNGMRQSNQNKGEEVLIPEYSLFDIGGFVYSQRFFKKATLSGGLRFDNRALDSKEFKDGADPRFPAFKRNFSNISGSIGISYEHNERLTVKSNIARGFRAPSLAELASNGAHEGTNRYEYGDNNLASEKSLQLDLGMELDADHFHINISGFYNHINDFIFYRKLLSVFGGDSLVNVDNEEIPAFQFDQHNAFLYGLEGSIDIHPHPFDWLHFENTFSYVRGKFTKAIDNSNNLPLVPAPKLVSELRSNIQKLGKHVKQFYVKVEAENVFRQSNVFTGFDTETVTPAYTIMNAGLGGNVVRKNNTLFSVHLSVINFTDKSYQNHLSRLKYADLNSVTGRRGVFNSGRNFSIKLNVPLEFKL